MFEETNNLDTIVYIRSFSNTPKKLSDTIHGTADLAALATGRRDKVWTAHMDRIMMEEERRLIALMAATGGIIMGPGEVEAVSDTIHDTADLAALATERRDKVWIAHMDQERRLVALMVATGGGIMGPGGVEAVSDSWVWAASWASIQLILMH